MSNVIQLPRPKALRPSPARAGHYLRVGRNDHREVAELLAEGERAYLGLVINAPLIDRHKELMVSARSLGLDIILDTKSQQGAFVGSYNDRIGELPWGIGRQSVVDDFTGQNAAIRAAQVAEFVEQNDFTAVLTPTHLIADANDPWLECDLAVSNELAAMLPDHVGVFYSLALPIAVLRDPVKRAAIITRMHSLQADALWLKVENFGSDSSGEKTRAYIEAMNDFSSLGVPIISDHSAGLPALGLLAFGAVGGVAHGVMVFEGFKASSWRRVSKGQPFAQGRRIYFHELDMLLKPAQAEIILGRSTRIRGQHSCRDTKCCPHGVKDMKAHPVRHYLRQRAREVEMVSSAPESVRVTQYLDNQVRAKSDATSHLASAGVTDNVLNSKIQKRNIALGRFRSALVNLAETMDHPLSPRYPKSRDQRR